MSTAIELSAKISHLNMKMEEMKDVINEYKKMHEHQSKVINIREKAIKDLKTSMVNLQVTNQSFKDKIEELQNELESMKETA